MSVDVPLSMGPEIDLLYTGTDPFLKITPQSPLLAGESYELAFTIPSGEFCISKDAESPVTFKVVDAAPLPTTLGELREAPRVISTVYGTRIDATYVLAEEMKPWMYLFEYTASISDTGTEPSFGVPAYSYPGGGELQLSWDLGTYCQSFETGTHHTIQAQAHLLFGPSVSSTATSLEFECEEPSNGSGAAPGSCSITSDRAGSFVPLSIAVGFVGLLGQRRLTARRRRR